MIQISQPSMFPNNYVSNGLRSNYLGRIRSEVWQESSMAVDAEKEGENREGNR